MISVRPEREPGSARRDRGDTMLMSVILIGFLMIGSMALINASDAWGHRRQLQSVADAAARAGAQITAEEVRAAGGSYVLDQGAARARAAAVIPDGFSLGSVRVNGPTVSVTVHGGNEVPFPGPGFGGVSADDPDGGDTATSTATLDYGVDD